jgi:uncharacterized protein
MRIGLIVKVSKFCNLRCTYCYETPWLADKARMSLEDIEKMFVHIRDYLWRQSRKPKDHLIDFYWHGGEPLAQPIEYWEEIIALQDRLFGRRFRKKSIINSLQSNLTLVTRKHLPLFRGKYRLGFSYDVSNDFRVNAGGQPTESVVEKHTMYPVRSEATDL